MNHRIFSAVAAVLASTAVAHAGPADGVVVAGAATIASTPGTTTIHQTSARAAIDWQSFDIGATETVRFAQPDAHSVTLNRVIGGSPSTLLGSLTANGKVFLVNPQGVLFGKGASVAVGSIVASTRDMSLTDFMAGRDRFAGTGDGRVLNEGEIRADGGYIALLGAQVANEGSLIAQHGSVALAAGSAFTLDIGGDGLLSVAVDAGAVDALARNGGLVQADGGRVLLTARSAEGLLPSAVNNDGTVRAQSLVNRGGRILLLGDMASGSVEVGGVLDASAPRGGDGGFIETSAAHVNIAEDAIITTAASAGATGQWLIDPFDFTIAASGGDVTGAALTAQLANSNVSVLSTAGATGVRGDLLVNDTVTWSANQLSLTAEGSLIINAPLAASGVASLALAYGTQAVAAGNASSLSVRAPVDLPAGNSLTVQFGSDGAVVPYTVITTMTGLQSINSGLAGNYALGSNVNASGFSGFVPIGNDAARFTGTFNGLAHTISNLSVNSATDNAGLFGVTDTGALVTSLRMTTTSVSAVGRNNAGSVVGYNYGTVREVYTTGVTISASRQAGGLAGLNAGLIESSAAGKGTTSATFFSGGLVAYQITPGVIRNSYSGVHSGSHLEVGGLVGGMDGGSIENSYADANPSGSTAIFGTGGFVGYVGGGTVSDSFWNTSRYAVGVRTGSAAGMTGLPTAQMQAESNFTAAGWDFTNVWVMYEGRTMPLLRAFMTPLTVTPNPVTTTYSGAAYAGTPGVGYSASPNLANVQGTPVYAGGGTNVGTYALTVSGLYSNQLGYIITTAPGTLSISPYAVSLTGSRAYDGTDLAAASVLHLGTLANGETLTLAGAGTVASSSVGAGKTLAPGSLALGDGTGVASNYTLAGGTATFDITPALLTATAVAADKTYDGSTLADVTLSLGGLVGSEQLGVAAEAVFNSKDVATANLVTVSSVTLSDGANGGLASNYSIAAGQTAAARITPKSLSVSGQTAADKVFDGSTAAILSGGALAGVVSGESIGLEQAGEFASPAVGEGLAVTAMNALSGSAADNYSLVQPTGLRASIKPVPVVVPPVVSPPVVEPPVVTPPVVVPPVVETPPPPVSPAPTPSVPAPSVPEAPVSVDPRASESWRGAVARSLAAPAAVTAPEETAAKPPLDAVLEGLALTVIRE